MAVFSLGALVLFAVVTVGGVKLWYDIAVLRTEVRQLREAQDALIDMMSTKMLEDDALSREFLKLKLGRARES